MGHPSDRQRSALDGQLEFVVDRLSAVPILTPEYILSFAAPLLPSDLERRTLSKRLMKLAKTCRDEGRFGRLRAAILLGVTLSGESFLTQAERGGLLLADDAQLIKATSFLSKLKMEVDAVSEGPWRLFSSRLTTYQAYARLLKVTKAERVSLIKKMQPRSRIWLRQLLALAELFFLHSYWGIELDPGLQACFSSFESAEAFADTVSTIFALANDYRRIDAWDFVSTEVGDLSNNLLAQIVLAGQLCNSVHDIQKSISLFSYELEESTEGDISIFLLRSSPSDFEYSVRLGYVRAEMGKNKTPLDIREMELVPDITLQGLAEHFVDRLGTKMLDIRDEGTPRRRLRVNLRVYPEMQKVLESTAFYDEAREREFLNHDFLIPLKREGTEEFKIAEHLTISKFFKTYRFLRFYALVNIALVKRYARKDPVIFFNSLIRITSEESLLELVGLSGLDAAASQEFLRLVSADSCHLGFYDLQYKPWFRYVAVTLPGRSPASQELAFGPAIMVASNVVRNVQVANKKRAHEDGKAFVDFVCHSLRKRFPLVVSEREVKASGLRTDIDAIVLENETLFLFECKHSITACSAYEMRDLWEDIEKGLQQLDIAARILLDEAVLRRYVSQWFPGSTVGANRRLKIVKCVLSSHRIFSGLHRDGAAIRDSGSLMRLLSDGKIGIGTVEDDRATMREFSLLKGGRMDGQQLELYLSPASPFHRSFEPFMLPVWLFQRFNRVVLARDTFAYQVSLEGWLNHVEALGAERLPDVVKELRTPNRSDGVFEAE